MKGIKFFVAAWLMSCAALTTACGGNTDLTPLLGSLFARQIRGTVTDDAASSPPGSSRVPTAIAGARVEVVDGPEKGRFAISAANGQFDLGVISAGSLLRATLTGWEFDESPVYATGSSTVAFALGLAPHAMWGNVYVTGSLQSISGVRVEILTGSNAGQVAMTNETGLYRFDNLATQGGFDVEFSKSGYRTERVHLTALRKNTNLLYNLTPQ